MGTTVTMLPPGYHLRVAEPRDIHAVAVLQAAVDITEYGVAETTEHDIAQQWCRDRFDVRRDAWMIIGPGGRVAGYIDVWEREPASQFDLDPYVAPGEPREPLERALLDVAVQRVRERGYATGPASPSVTLHTVRALTDIEGDALLARLGWHVVRGFLRMAIDLAETAPEPTWPPRLAVRPLRLGTDDATAHAALEESFAGHFRHQPSTLASFRSRHLGEGFDGDLAMLAWEGTQCAGVMLGYQDGAKVWVRRLAVRPAWQGRGLGMAMLLAAFQRCHARGLRRVELGLDAQNDSALRLYERAGMRAVRTYRFYARTLCLSA